MQIFRLLLYHSMELFFCHGNYDKYTYSDHRILGFFVKENWYSILVIMKTLFGPSFKARISLISKGWIFPLSGI